MRDYNKLITSLDDFELHNDSHIGADGWLACMGSFNYAVVFSSLFFPEFEVYHDSVFIAPVTDLHKTHFHSFGHDSPEDVIRTEVTMNHQHILDLFPNTEESPTKEQIVYLGRILKEIWQLKLDRETFLIVR